VRRGFRRGQSWWATLGGWQVETFRRRKVDAPFWSWKTDPSLRSWKIDSSFGCWQVDPTFDGRKVDATFRSWQVNTFGGREVDSTFWRREINTAFKCWKIGGVFESWQLVRESQTKRIRSFSSFALRPTAHHRGFWIASKR